MAFWVAIQVFLKGLEADQGKLKMKRGESEETEVVAALAGAPEASEAPNLSHSNQPLVSNSIHGTTNSRRFTKGHLKSPRIQDSINEGT
ncbi:hypothetical protein O181_109234 [Austropuccinia psidii MF-1]|uniref:Uncharacterized protein n=1 Tax=Austropuccinia psidii MF-1 TaxID=1389203 RepID=A0A9Q3JW93_9BASI|nr:hypothetical protein [Austropuccinia psidii MF-1]